jgi:hypothetical protein
LVTPEEGDRSDAYATTCRPMGIVRPSGSAGYGLLIPLLYQLSYRLPEGRRTGLEPVTCGGLVGTAWWSDERVKERGES